MMEENSLKTFVDDKGIGRGEMPRPSHAIHYMEKVTCNPRVGLGVKLFKGNTLTHLACTLQSE